MADEKGLQERVEALSAEIELLKQRVSDLEAGNLHRTVPVSGGKTTAPDRLQDARSRVETKSREVKSKLTKEGLESLIGGKLLNRVGILVLLFGVAYFLKYSFDNQWIGELGRVVIGFVSGIAFLVAGDMLMRRNYRYFSQGFTGGGIGVIYLTTFAAANFYQLIAPGTAFVLLVLAALAGGVLSLKQNAYGVAVLSALGGFLSPFLIGSTEANPLALLSYIAILDLAVLCLAHYKNWRSLNLLAFFGTASVYLIYRGANWHIAQESIGLNQGFLTLYFIIFAALTFIYNVRHGLPTKAPEVILLVLNAAFFFGASADNLDSKYYDWLGTFAIVMAVVYLAIGLLLKKRNKGDDLLFLSLLGTGLAFVTIAIPIQLEDDRIMAIAWLVEAIILIYAGLKGSNRWIRRAGLSLLFLVSFAFHADSPYFYETPVPLINSYSLAANLSVVGFFLVAHLFYHSTEATKNEKLLVWPAALVGTFLAIKQISWEVINGIAYYQLDYSEDFAVSLAWVLFAVFLMVLGMLRDLKGMRFISLGLFCLTTLKVMLLDLSGLPMAFRILILIIVGAILIGVSFVYQRKESKGEGL